MRLGSRRQEKTRSAHCPAVLACISAAVLQQQCAPEAATLPSCSRDRENSAAVHTHGGQHTPASLTQQLVCVRASWVSRSAHLVGSKPMGSSTLQPAAHTTSVGTITRLALLLMRLCRCAPPPAASAGRPRQQRCADAPTGTGPHPAPCVHGHHSRQQASRWGEDHHQEHPQQQHHQPQQHQQQPSCWTSDSSSCSGEPAHTVAAPTLTPFLFHFPPVPPTSPSACAGRSSGDRAV